MNRFWIILPVIAVMLIAAVFIGGCGGRDANYILVGIDNNPPYTFINHPVVEVVNENGVNLTPNNEMILYTGFDIDVIAAVASKAGLKIEYRETPFASLLPQIEQGNIDVAIGGISVTEERKKKVEFTVPYAKGGACVVVFQGDNINNIDDLAGKVIGAEIGTTMIDQAKDIKGASINGYNKEQDLFLALYNGDIDALVMDKMSAEYYIKERKIKRLKIIDMLSEENFAMVVKSGNQKLADKLNQALIDMEKSGELKTIYDKWFAR